MASTIDILKNLECPVCINYMNDRIFQCKTGHSLCEHCFGKLKECPTCKKPLESTRNYALESIAATVKFPRQNKRKVMSCRMEQCSWNDTKDLYLNHVKEKHINCYTKTKWETSWARNEEADNVMLIEYKGEIFHLYQKVRDQTMYWAIQYIGACENAKNYKYNIKMNRGGKSVSVVDICYVDTQTIDEIIEGKGCIDFTFSQLEKYIDPNREKVFFEVIVMDKKKKHTTSDCHTYEQMLRNSGCHTYGCFFPNCSKQNVKFGRLNFVQHVKSHTNCYINQDSCTISKTDNDDFGVLETFGSLFGVYQKVKDDKIYWFVQYLGALNNAGKYEYTVCMDNEDEPFSKRTCGNVLQNLDEVIKRRNCPCILKEIDYGDVSIYISEK